jgi:hypothetical protein
MTAWKSRLSASPSASPAAIAALSSAARNAAWRECRSRQEQVLSLPDGTVRACPGGQVRLLGTRVQAEEARLAAGPGQRETGERPVDTGGLGALEPPR